MVAPYWPVVHSKIDAVITEARFSNQVNLLEYMFWETTNLASYAVT